MAKNLKMLNLIIIPTFFFFIHNSIVTASYFVNWTYQNPKSCTVVVGEPPEVFPPPKATSLEFANKSMARPHQSLPTIGTGKEEHHSRQRRSVDVVDGHASSLPQSVSSEDSSSTVNMHDITTPFVNTVSLVHGVAEDITTERDEENSEGSNNAFVSSSSSYKLVNTGDLTTNNPGTSTTKTTVTGSSTITQTSEDPTEILEIVSTTNTPISLDVKTKETNYINSTPIKTNNNNQESHVDQPPEINEHIDSVKKEADNIAYVPEDMQADSFPSIRSYGIEKLKFIRYRSELEQVQEVLHIDSSDIDNNLQKFHYESENNSKKKGLQTVAPNFGTTVPDTTTETTVKPTTAAITTIFSTDTTLTSEPVTTNAVLTTRNTFTTHNEHVVSATPTLSVTNSNKVTTIASTETPPDEASTVNNAESKLPDVSNPKHVLINLTISADNAESSSYKQLYSFTLTVPTVGDTGDIPTVKITPMDVEPTFSTNFNKPVTLEGSTKVKEVTDVESDLGGSCECSCPACISNATDDFYDDLIENGSTTASPKSESLPGDNQFSSTESSDSSETSTEDSTNSPGSTESLTDITDFTTETSTDISTTSESLFTTDSTEFTTDSTTETDIFSTTNTPPCVCPKIMPPPILILEGEVDLQ